MRLMCRIWCTRLVPLISDPVNRQTLQRNAIEVPMPVPVAAAHHLGARHTKGVWLVENLLANAAGLAGAHPRCCGHPLSIISGVELSGGRLTTDGGRRLLPHRHSDFKIMTNLSLLNGTAYLDPWCLASQALQQRS